ncbi:class I SAM-dependent methyltransferase [Oceanibium sediminis]|uniref:class I SAM-dependent methyltransferase n=1 Tax=Oceanibium sediminis TaxID=2026339 RepID=UPI000DD40002|nr:class I SAM-dependent methyltransferase [Oceanibium sediminis]
MAEGRTQAAPGVLKRLKKTAKALERGWVDRFDPLESARRAHREAYHARKRKFLRRYVPEGGVGAEVGVFWAHFSEVLAGHFKPAKLYLVDPWDRLHGETFSWSTPYTLDGTLKTRDAMARAEALARRYPGVVEVRKQYSTEFFAEIPDGTLDFVYLDAAHKYEDVLADLTCIWPKLKPTGVLIGDDYFEDPGAKHAGTKRAVDHFAKRHDIALIKEDHYQYILPRADAPLPDEENGTHAT